MSYCEWLEFYHETFPKARKQHSCVECAAPILVGEEHLYWRGKWDQNIHYGRQHMLCRQICMYIRDHLQDGECLAFGELHENSVEWSRKNPRSPHAVQVRSLYARVKWRERRFRSHSKWVAGRNYRRPWGGQWELVSEQSTSNKEAAGMSAKQG